jgi:hypothetical protein
MASGRPIARGWRRFLTGWRRTAISAVVIVAALIVWSVCTTAVTRTDDPATMVGPANPSSIRSVAYSVARGSVDEIYIRDIDGVEAPRLLARLPFAFSFRARGSSSPDGSLVAVVSVPNVAARGSLSIWPVQGTPHVVADGAFEYLTSIAWRADGSRLAAVRHATPDESGRITAVIVEIDPTTGAGTTLSVFERVNEAAPIGYSSSGELYVVTIDQAGSTFWAVREGAEPQQVASLSSGKTRDWALSPDLARLAYVEQSSSSRTDTGRILVIATGQFSAVAGESHVGVAWIPGTDVAVFGGPGGNLQFTDADTVASGAYLAPLAWSPDGTALVAEAYESLDPDGVTLLRSLELVTRQTRALLADEPRARFFGWVVNPDQDGGAGE